MPFKRWGILFFHWNTKLIRKTFSIRNHPSWPPAEKFCNWIIAFKYTEAIICVFHSIDKKKYKRGKNAKKGKHNSFEYFEHVFNSFKYLKMDLIKLFMCWKEREGNIVCIIGENISMLWYEGFIKHDVEIGPFGSACIFKGEMCMLLDICVHVCNCDFFIPVMRD